MDSRPPPADDAPRWYHLLFTAFILLAAFLIWAVGFDWFARTSVGDMLMSIVGLFYEAWMWIGLTVLALALIFGRKSA